MNGHHVTAPPEQKSPEDTVTVTISLLGTSYHQRNPENQSILISLLKCVATSPTQATYLINGVAGEALDPADPRVKLLYPDFVPEGDTFMLGQYDASISFDAATGIITTKKTFKPYFQQAGKLGGYIAGYGAKDARQELIQLAKAIFASGKKSVVFNIVAFSRGADTAIRAANDIQAHFGYDKVTVNIIAIDPVTGPFRDALEARIIPKTVGEFFAILMLDENRYGFEPLSDFIIEDRARTRWRYQIYSGEHCDSSRENFEAPEKNYSANLAAVDIQQFLLRNGTCLAYTLPVVRLIKGVGDFETYPWRLFRTRYIVKTPGKIEERGKIPIDDSFVKEMDNLNEVMRFDIYTRMAANREKQIQGWLTAPRGFTLRKAEYFLHGDDYFVNKEHQELFKQFFPCYFDYFFQHCAEKTSYEKVSAELTTELSGKTWRGGRFPESLAKSLTKAGYVFPEKSAEKSNDPSPRGVRLIAEFTVLKRQPENKLINLMCTTIAAARHVSAFESDKTAIAQADQLCIKLQKIVKENPGELSAEQFNDYCLAKFKIAIAETFFNLTNSIYRGIFYYQLDEILSRHAHIKLLLGMLKNPLIANDQGARKLIVRLTETMEAILSDSILTNDKKIQAINQIMNIYLVKPDALDETISISSVKDAFIGYIKASNLHNMNIAAINSWINGTRLDYLEFVTQELTTLLAQSGFLKSLPVIQEFTRELVKEIVERVKIEMQKNLLESHTSLLMRIINRSITASAEFRMTEKMTDELNIETVLRKLQMGLTTFEMKQFSDRDEQAAEKIFAEFSGHLDVLAKKEKIPREVKDESSIIFSIT